MSQDQQALVDALASFVQPYGESLYLMSRTECESVPVEIMTNIFQAIDSTDAHERERGYNAAQALMVAGVKVVWAATVSLRSKLAVMS